MDLFGCNECGRFFPSQYKLNLHHRNQHLKKACELCDIIVGAPNYSRHMKDVHSFLDGNMNKQYKCDLCTQSFSRKDNFQSHVNTILTLSLHRNYLVRFVQRNLSTRGT